MFISDLNYLEAVSDASVTGGGKKRSYGDKNVSYISVYQEAYPTAVALNFGKYGYAKANANVSQSVHIDVDQDN